MKSSQTLRILIAGGGTAGHVIPALAVADALSARDCEVVFVGTNRGMEAEIVPKAGYRLYFVRVRGFARRSLSGFAEALSFLPLAAWDAWRVIRRVNPHCVVGVGAYASAPAVFEAALLGTPTVILEMDARMGLANRVLSKIVDKVCLSFPSARYKGAKFVHTGRPIRPSLLACNKSDGLARFGLDVERPVLLVFGGSLGAKALNDAVLQAFATQATRFQIIHVTGQRYYEEVSTFMKERGLNPSYHVYPFIHDFHYALAAADVVISRAGGSVAEILARQIPAILVPFSLAAGNHQLENARYLAEQGAAVLVEEEKLTPVLLLELVDKLLQPDVASAMRANASRLARPDAATRVADVIVELASQKKGKI